MQLIVQLLVVLVTLYGSLASASERAQSPGIHEQEITLSSGHPLRYTLAIPESYSPQQPLPLILALHYAGQVTPFYGRGVLTQLVEPALSELGALIVAPDCPADDWFSPVSEAVVMMLLDDLSKHYPIDKQRTLVTGYSMGGVGTWAFTARRPDFFAAGIPVSGVPPPGTVEANDGVPLYIIHSRNDTVFPLRRTEQAVERLQVKGVNVKLVVLDDLTHFDIAGFVPHLKAAIPWIKDVWGKNAQKAKHTSPHCVKFRLTPLKRLAASERKMVQSVPYQRRTKKGVQQ